MNAGPGSEAGYGAAPPAYSPDPVTELKLECPYKILFGPLYLPAVLGRWMGHPNIRCFNFAQGVRVTEFHHPLQLEAESYYDIASASFNDILAALPPGWEPDLVVWYNLALMGIPPGIEDCPYPTLGVVHDWPLNFHPTLDYVGAFDYIVAERGFLACLERIGYRRCGFWPCYSHDPTQHYLIPGLERPHDVVFLGNMDYHYHRARNPWLERLARLGDRYRVLLTDRYYRDDFTRLLNQSKISFNFAVRGEMNIRIYEIAASGAMVLSEEDNLHIRDFLVDGESCVLYNQDNFEEKIIYYLEHPAERQRIARNGVAAISAYTYEQQFRRLIDLVPTVRAAFAGGERQAFRRSPRIWRSLLQARHFSQCLPPGSRERGLAILDGLLNESVNTHIPSFSDALSAAIDEPPGPAEPATSAEMLTHVRAVRATLELNRYWQSHRLIDPAPFPPEAHAALQQLEAVVARLPDDPWHAYNLANALSLMRQPAKALPLWQRLLPRLATMAIDLAAFSWVPLLPRGHDREMHDFNYLWDKTAGTVLAGDESPEALRRLLLWQLFELSGYCLMWLQRPDDALQAFLQSEAVGPASFYTYAPLLQLLSQSGREAELLACLQRAVAGLGLIESLQRDLIMALLRQKRWNELRPVLDFYRLLLTSFQGGSTVVRESMQAWIPDFMVWIPELLQTQLEWAGRE